MNRPNIVALESLIDAEGLAVVVNALAIICHGKAEHLESNWQDPNTARAWTKAATTIEKSARNIDHRL